MDGFERSLPFLIGAIGGLGAIIPTLMRQERKRNLKTFQALDSENMTPFQIWEAAMEYNQDKNKRLTRAEGLCKLGEQSIEVAQGLLCVARLERNKNVPRWVVFELFKEWGPRFCIVHGFDLKFADMIKKDCESVLKKVKPHPNDHIWRWIMMRARSRR